MELTSIVEIDEVFTEEQQAALVRGLKAGSGKFDESIVKAFLLWAAERVLEARLVRGVIDGQLTAARLKNDYTFALAPVKNLTARPN